MITIKDHVTGRELDFLNPEKFKDWLRSFKSVGDLATFFKGREDIVTYNCCLCKQPLSLDETLSHEDFLYHPNCLKKAIFQYKHEDIHWQACCPKCGAEQEDIKIEDGCHPFCSDCYCKKCETEFSIDENNHIHYYKK